MHGSARGKLAIVLMFGSVIVGGLFLRWGALVEWHTSQAFTRHEEPHLALMQQLVARLRMATAMRSSVPGRGEPQAPREQAELQAIRRDSTALESQVKAVMPMGGGAQDTQQKELAVLDAMQAYFVMPTPASASLGVEQAYGALVARVRYTDPGYGFQVAPRPGTVPPPPHRWFI